jgi:hypothetical protein
VAIRVPVHRGVRNRIRLPLSMLVTRISGVWVAHGFLSFWHVELSNFLQGEADKQIETI